MPGRAQAQAGSCEHGHPAIDTIIDRDFNMYWRCRPVNAEELAALLATATAHGVPPKGQVEILADGEGRFQAAETAIRSYYAVGVRRVQFSVGESDMGVRPNEIAKPGLSVSATIEPATAPPTVHGEALRVDIDYDGALFLGGKSISVGDLSIQLEAAFKANPGASVIVRPNRLSRYGVFMHVVLEAKRLGVRNIFVLFERERT